MRHPDFFYEGFSRPNFTGVPDEFFDIVMRQLSEAELKVALYITRRTFGFKKSCDAISMSQMVNGIQMRDGTQLDHGTGLSKQSVLNGVKGLLAKGIIEVQRTAAAPGDSDINVYSLRFASPAVSSSAMGPRQDGGVVQNLDHPSPKFRRGVVQNLDGGGLNFRPGVVQNLDPQHDRSQHDREQQHGRQRPARPNAGSRTATGLTDAQSGVPDNPILTGLLRLGMTRQSAARILRDHPADTVADWLSALPFIPNAKEPAAFLTQALKKNWALPQQYLQAQKKSELAKKKRVAADAAVSAQVMADEARLDRKVKVDAYLAVLDDDDRRALEAEASARVRAEDDGSYWKDRNIPTVLLKSCLRTIVAERMGLPPLDESMTSGEFTAVSSEVAR